MRLRTRGDVSPASAAHKDAQSPGSKKVAKTKAVKKSKADGFIPAEVEEFLQSVAEVPTNLIDRGQGNKKAHDACLAALQALFDLAKTCVSQDAFTSPLRNLVTKGLDEEQVRELCNYPETPSPLNVGIPDLGATCVAFQR